MPHRVVTAPDVDPARSLGWLALWWIESFVVHGPGEVAGEPVVHGDEYSQFLVNCYALQRNGKRAHLSAFFSRPKGCDKSGIAARLALFEALGPARFDGWAKGGETYTYLGETYTYEAGEPMGKPVKYPKVRLMATEEKQVAEVYDVIFLNLDEGPLSELKASGMNVSHGQIELPDGGWIRPSTSGASSKDGGKETFIVFDETHLFNTPILRTMYATSTRNLPKRQAVGEPWFLETTTMFAPGEESVAEATFELVQQIEEGKHKRPKILFDHRYSDLKDLSNDEELADALRDAYGEASNHNPHGWLNVEDFIDAIHNSRDANTASHHRYYLNALVERSDSSWLTPADLAAITLPRTDADGTVHAPRVVQYGEQITLGFDGALKHDATALMACCVSDGYMFKIRVEEIPDGPEAVGWHVDQSAFDAAVARTFEQFEVVGFFADPPYWETYLEKWEKEFGDRLLVKSGAASAIKFYTAQEVKMSRALDRWHTAITTESCSITADSVIKRHLLNANKWEKRGGVVIGKQTKNSPRKIDAAVAATLAFEARAQFLANGAEREEETWVPRRIR